MMNTRSMAWVVTVAGATLALSGCADFGLMGQGGGATATSACSLRVKVTVPLSGGSATLPDPVCVASIGGTVSWVVPSGAFTFDSPCATVTPTSGGYVVSPPGNQGVDTCVVSLGATGATKWTYSLTFIELATPTSPARQWFCDPTIVNRDTSPLVSTGTTTKACTITTIP